MRAYNEKGSKAGKRKLAKQMLNELFHIEDKKISALGAGA